MRIAGGAFHRGLLKLTSGSDISSSSLHNHFGVWSFQAVTKPDDQTLGDDDELQDDDDLTFLIGASEVWIVEYSMRFSSTDSAADVKFGLNVPSGATYRLGTQALFLGAGSLGPMRVDSITTGTVTSGTIAQHPLGLMALIFAVVTNGTTAGSVTIQWAEEVKTGGNTLSMMQGSTLQAFRTT